MMSSRHNKALVLTLSMALASMTLVGCSGKEDRQAKYLQRAHEYLDKGDYDKARIEAKNVLQINANNGEARFVLAQIDEHDGNWQQMFGNLTSAIEADPKLIKARVKLAQLLIAYNQPDKAREQIEKIRQQEPNNADAFAASAAILLRENKPEEAVAESEKALQYKPGHTGATAVLVSIYQKTNPAKAEQLLADSIRVNPKEAELRMMQINLFAGQNRIDDVVASFAQVIKDNPDNLNYPTQLAKFYLSQQRPDDAEAVLRQLVKDHPDKDEAKLLLVEFTVAQNKPDAARALLEQYSAAAPDNYKLRSALARVYASTGDVDKAIATYQYTISKDVHGEGIDARNQVIALLLAQNKRPEAEALLKDVLKLEPENTDALLTRARLALIDNDPNSAIADLRAILKNVPDSPMALTLLATAQERTGALNLALDNYKKVLDKNPDNLPALTGAARLQLAQNQLDDAQKLLEHGHKLAAGNLDVTRLLVELYVRKQKFPEALALCDELTLNSNTAAAGFYMKGFVLLQKKELAGAIEALKMALEKQPQAAEPLQLLIVAYSANKQSDAAIAYLEKHTKTYPEQIQAQELLGALYRQAGKLAQAEQLLSGVLQKQPSRISTYRELITVYALQKQPARIDELLAKGLQQNPDNVDLLLMQAEFFQSTGKDKQALENYNKALALQPKSDVVKNNLAMLLIEKFDSEENLRRAQSLIADFADSNNPQFVDTLAWLQYKMKNYPQAISLLESVLKKGTDSPELRYHLGMAYLKNGAADKAKTELTKATATPAQYPGRAEAEAELRKL